MANPHIDNVNAYLQYEDDSDALQNCGFEIKSIPKSANCNHATADHQSNPGDEDYYNGIKDPTFLMHVSDCIRIWLIPRTALNINSILSDENDEDKRRQQLETWIKQFRTKMIVVDVGRIMRFAIYRGLDEVASYLMDHEDANLQQEDTLKRTAIFYAAGSRDLNILKYVAEKMGPERFQEGLSCQDIHKKTPLYYASKSHSVDNVEFLLTAGAVPDDTTLKYWSGPPRDSGGLREDDVTQIRLLFLLYNELKLYRRFPVYSESQDQLEFNTELFTVNDMQTNPEVLAQKQSLTWIHVPATNVSSNQVIIWSVLTNSRASSYLYEVSIFRSHFRLI